MKQILIDIALIILFVACGGGSPLMAQHYMTLNWTAPTQMVGGGYLNIYKGNTAGAEAATPLNPQPIADTAVTYQDNNVLPNSTYYYVIKQCAIDQTVQKEVCSPPSNEAKGTIGLASSDLVAPGMLTAIAH